MIKDLTILTGKHLIETQHFSGHLLITTPGLFYEFKGEGDCCNAVWIEDVDNLDALQNAEVLEVHDTESEDDFFVTIKTTKGLCTISVRNDQQNPDYAYEGRIVLSRLVDDTGAVLYEA